MLFVNFAKLDLSESLIYQSLFVISIFLSFIGEVLCNNSPSKSEYLLFPISWLVVVWKTLIIFQGRKLTSCIDLNLGQAHI